MPKTVLVIDDEPEICDVLERQLTAGGYEVVTAESGREGIDKLLAGGCSLMIADLEMPEIDGLELCRRVHDHEGIGFVYTIILTGHPHDDRLIAALDAGADDCMSKPWNGKELLARLRAGERIVELERDLARKTRDLAQSAAEMAIANRRLAGANRKLSCLVTTDELTDLPNRRAAVARLNEYWTLASRHDALLSCILIDIDHFKTVNDTYGHAVGDAVLAATAKHLREVTRGEEMVARVGGEEFLVLCPHSTAEETAVAAERQCRAIEAHVLRHGEHELKVTISAGVAEATDEMIEPEDLLIAADAALYAAKRAGRNCVRLAGEAEDAPAPLSDRRATPHEGAFDANHDAARVLIVSDDASIRSALSTRLELEHYDLYYADDAQDAFSQFVRVKPDVLVMEAHLPGLSGIECIRRFKEGAETRHVPIILFGPRLESHAAEAALAAGADECLGKPLRPSELSLRVRSMVQLSRLHRAMNNRSSSADATDGAAAVVGMAKLAEQRDGDTGRHLNRVTRYCRILARELRANSPYSLDITEDFIEQLRQAVPLHDIGKVGIPDAVLQKPGRLSSDEVDIMRRHVEIGRETIRSLRDHAPELTFLAMAEDVAFSHHEWFDGSGYPSGLAGEDIPLPARIAALADVYDAIVSERVYKDPASHEQAVQHIERRRGTQFDPVLVDAFLRCEMRFAEVRIELDAVDSNQAERLDHRDVA